MSSITFAVLWLTIQAALCIIFLMIAFKGWKP